MLSIILNEVSNKFEDEWIKEIPLHEKLLDLKTIKNKKEKCKTLIEDKMICTT